MVFSFSHSELDLTGQHSALNLVLPSRQKPVVSFGVSLGEFFSMATGETDESVSVWSVPVGSLYYVKQDGQKQLRGICTMQYFQSFIIVLFLFSPLFKLFLSSVGLSVLNIVILLFLKKQTLNKFLFFI